MTEYFGSFFDSGYTPLKLDPDKASSLLKDSSTFVGIEVELENVMPTSIRDWINTTDGSLRSGVEYVLENPQRGINLVKSLRRFSEVMEKAKPLITERCSMHVHLDVRDMEINKLKHFVDIYSFFESTLFHYVGYYRVKSNYCKPLNGSTFYEEIYSKLVDYSNNPTSVYELLKYRSCKYSALNLRSIIKFGSIEFRHHPGSIDYREIIEWINIVQSIKTFVVSGGTLEDLINFNFKQALKTVFNDLYKILLSDDSLNHHLKQKDDILFNLLTKDSKEISSKVFSRKSSAAKKLISVYKGDA